METVVILIGNSDDKLSQLEWSNFISDVYNLVERKAKEIHFTGTSLPNSRYQNACFVLETMVVEMIKIELDELRKKYRQYNIAIVRGATEYIGNQYI